MTTFTATLTSPNGTVAIENPGLDYETAHRLARVFSQGNDTFLGRVRRDGEHGTVALFRGGKLIYDRTGATEHAT